MTQMFSVPTDAVHVVVDDTLAYGKQELETGGFLMAPVGSDSIDGVALAGDSGILRRSGLFQISERALDRLFAYSDERELWLPIQFHSHQFEAGMSRTDALHGLRVEGFISTIVPRFTEPPADVSQWGWWQFRNGAWQSRPPAAVQHSPLTRVVVFDEDGIRER